MNIQIFIKWMKEFSVEWDNMCEKLRNSGAELKYVKLASVVEGREDE